MRTQTLWNTMGVHAEIGQRSHLWPHFEDFTPSLELQLWVLRCKVLHCLLQALMVHRVHISKVDAQAELVVLYTASGDGFHPENQDVRIRS